MENIHLITPDVSKSAKNVHIERNLRIFSSFGVHCEYVDNRFLLKRNIGAYDVIYLNWFENIDGGSFLMPVMRYLRRKIQLYRIKKSGIRVIFCKHNRFPHDARYPGLSKNVYRELCDAADIILAFNNDAGEDLSTVFPDQDYSDKIRIVPPVNYIGAYRPNPASDIYQAMTPYKGSMVVGFVGKINPYKNVELILEAAHELEDENIHFLIAGNPETREYGEYLSGLAAGAGNITTIFERIPDADICPVLDVCDVLLMPYDKVSASNSGTGRLAFSYGKTVISPDISSMNMIPPELIFKYHYDTPEEHFRAMYTRLTEAYHVWKADPNALKEMGDGLLHLMETEYSEHVVTSKYKDIFEELF